MVCTDTKVKGKLAILKVRTVTKCTISKPKLNPEDQIVVSLLNEALFAP